MKSKIFISVFVVFILFTACKKNDITNLFDTVKSAKDKLISSDTLVNENSFNKTDFKDRAEELIYIREYLKYKLPEIIIDEDLELVKKAQYELITDGENPTLIEAAKRTIAFSNKYEGYMYLISSENMSFKEVKRQLKTKGKINFSLPAREISTDNSKNETQDKSLNTVDSISENIYPDYLFDLNQYSPKISHVCEDQGYSDCFRDVTETVKELVGIRKIHLNNRYNKEYLNFYETSKAIAEKRSWEKDASDIDSYIVENIKIYDDAIKNCDYDNLDWFKKLPKDLYQHFNLNEKELLNNIDR